MKHSICMQHIQYCTFQEHNKRTLLTKNAGRHVLGMLKGDCARVLPLHKKGRLTSRTYCLQEPFSLIYLCFQYFRKLKTNAPLCPIRKTDSSPTKVGENIYGLDTIHASGPYYNNRSTFPFPIIDKWPEAITCFCVWPLYPDKCAQHCHSLALENAQPSAVSLGAETRPWAFAFMIKSEGKTR